MRLLSRIMLLLLFLTLASGLLAFQRRGYDEDDEESPIILPPGWHDRVNGEWVLARFRYQMSPAFNYGGFQRWAADYPKADRQFTMAVTRLTRIDTRTTPLVVDATTDDMYNWPWIYVEDPGQWKFSDAEADRMREYLARGGFIMFDDTHGDYEWAMFMSGLRKVFPDRPIENLKDDDEIFHVLYDLSDRAQIPGTRYIWGSRQYTPDSAVPQWMAIRDDKGRIIVAICHNSDVGDAWEWADSPRYPEKLASLAFRIGINYIIYGMTH